MIDLVLESFRALVLAGIVGFLWHFGRRQLKGGHEGVHGGWGAIVAGFGLLLFGSLLDITDNFEILNRFVVLGDTEVEAFLEKFVGFLGGFAVLAWGLFRWVPKVGALAAEIEQRKRAEQTLRDERSMLDLRVQERTAEIDRANVELQNEIAVRLQSDAALQASEARLRAIFDHAPMEIYLKDLDGHYLEINRRYEELWGVENAEVRGKLPDEVHGDTNFAEASRSHDMAVLESGEVVEQEDEVDIDGATHALHMIKFPIRSDDGEVTGLGGIAIDVTERKRAEVALRESRDQLRLVTDNLPVVIVYLDAELRYRFANKTCAVWYARSSEDILGKHVEEILGSEFVKIRSQMDAVMAGEDSTFEQVITYPDGVTRDTRITYVPHRGSDSELYGFFAFVEDITKYKRVEEQLRQAQKMEAVGQLTGGIAHDFNNLLGIILGNSELLSDRVGKDNPQIDALLRAANRGGDLTQRLLAFSRHQPSQPKAIDAGHLVSNMVEMFRRSLGEAIEIEIATDEGLWNVTVDPGMLENALLNLAINARDAMSGTGTLVIEIANAAHDAVHSPGRDGMAPRNYVRLSVTDTGVGMAPEIVERVFEPFFTTKDVGKGSGLGLAMVYSFAEQSGGHVSVNSEMGKGTTVNLYLPQTEEAVAAAAPESKEGLPLGRGETILVVEDNPDIRELAIIQLEGLGYRVRVAPDGKSALASLDESPDIDLLLTDIVLPGGLDGCNLAQKVEQRLGRINVLFMSGYTEHAVHINDWVDRGGDLLQKPFRRQELAKKVRSALDSLPD